MNGITNRAASKVPKTAREFLRRDPGAQRRIARRLKVNPSTVSRVLSGEKTSTRVTRAVLSEVRRLARVYGAAAILADVECGPAMGRK